MMRPWKIGEAFGIGVYVHWSFLLLPALVVLQNLAGGLPLALFALIMTLAVFGCVVLHEYGHALTARLFGIQTRDITLYPIGGVARMERMSEKPWEEFWIAIAGPAVNVVIAGLLAAVLFFAAAVNPLVVQHSYMLEFLSWLLIANVVLVVFNLLPAFPSDGGRILRALLSLKLGHLQATRIAAGVGAVMAVLIGVVGLVQFGSYMMPILAFFLYMAGQQELQAVEWQHRQRWQYAYEEVPPVQPNYRQPQPDVFDPRTVQVYTWDAQAGVWVPEKRIRPYPLG